MKSGNLNFLEPSGPLQASNGTALPLALQIVILHAWKDHRTCFTLCKFPSYFMLAPMAVCVLFFLAYSRV